MRIVIDAMGTDDCPIADVEGTVLAAKEYGGEYILTGDQPKIEAELSKYAINNLNITIKHTDTAVTMHDKPGDVVKGRANSSMHVGIRMVKEDQADAYVSMGNTGATLAISFAILGRIRGVKRPALTAIYPIHSKNKIFLDIGTNTDSKPEWLKQFAIMGAAYGEAVLGWKDPRIALMSNGEEDTKGDLLVQETHQLLKESSLNFVGNLEPKGVLSGDTDVIVMDGFVGNVFMKTFESTMRYMNALMKEEFTRNILSSAGALLLKPAFGRIKKRLDTSEVGGAPLLGVDGIVIIGHGSSNAYAVKNAISQARLAVENNALSRIKEQLAHTDFA